MGTVSVECYEMGDREIHLWNAVSGFSHSGRQFIIGLRSKNPVSSKKSSIFSTNIDAETGFLAPCVSPVLAIARDLLPQCDRPCGYN